MKIDDIMNQSFQKVVTKYEIDLPSGELSSSDLYHLADDIITLHNRLAFSEDEEALMDQAILKAIIDKLDEFDFAED